MPTPTEIQTCINDLTSSSEVTEMVILAAETNAVTQNRAISVADTNSLPDLNTTQIAVGTVFFVQSLQIPVVAGVGSWTGLDNRVLRQDYPAADIWAWGNNGFGQLGDDTAVNKSSPVSVVGGFGFCDWCQVSAGWCHSLGIRINGTAWAWGSNDQGRLGDDSTVSKRSPVSVVGGFTDWCDLSGGEFHSIGVRTNGTSWAWGCNWFGVLGNNSTQNRSSPVSVVGGFTNWCGVSGGRNHSLGVRQAGTAWAWGSGSCGVLGDNTTTNRSSPGIVAGGFTDWCQVSAGNQHSLGVRQNGTAWAWGFNNAGQLGINSTVNRSSPGQVTGGFTDWCQISTGCDHSLGVRQNGTAWSWGCNNCGQLGAVASNRSSPGQMSGVYTNWCQVSAGCKYSLGVRQNGIALGWGINISGQLGRNNNTTSGSPASVVGEFTDWCQVSAGAGQSLGLRKY